MKPGGLGSRDTGDHPTGATRPVDLPPAQATSSNDPLCRPSGFGRGDERMA